MKIFIAIIVIAAIAGVGYAMFRGEAESPAGETTSSSAPSAVAPDISATQPSNQATDKIFKCVSENSVIYTAPNKFKTEITNAASKSVRHQLVRDGATYLWEMAGARVKLDAAGSHFASKQTGINSDVITKAYYQTVPGYAAQGFSCNAWMGGEEVFKIPADINFKVQ